MEVDIFDGKERVEQRLQNMGLNSSTLINVLKDTKSVIAGSFPLQVHLGVIWDNSDIDIWTKGVDNASHIASELIRMGYIIPRKSAFMEKKKRQIQGSFMRRSFPEATMKESKQIYEKVDLIGVYKRLDQFVNGIYMFNSENKALPKIQVLCIKDNVSLKDTVNNFDLSICNVVFDGDHIFSFNPKTKLDIQNKILRITSEAYRLQSIYEFPRTLRRIVKYIKRGFKLDYVSLTDAVRYGLQAYRNNYVALTDFANKWNEIFTENIILDKGTPRFYMEKSGIKLLLGSKVLASINIQTNETKGYYDELPNDEEPRAPENFYQEDDGKVVKCLDLVMFNDEQDINDYIAEEDGNIALYYKNNAVCIPIEQIIKAFEKYRDYRRKKNREMIKNMDNTIFYECKTEKPEPEFNMPYYLLRLQGNYLVPLMSIRSMIRYYYKNKTKKFRLVPLMEDDKQRELQYTMSHEMALLFSRTFRRRDNGDMTSADHCQDGSNKLVYKIVPIGNKRDTDTISYGRMVDDITNKRMTATNINEDLLSNLKDKINNIDRAQEWFNRFMMYIGGVWEIFDDEDIDTIDRIIDIIVSYVYVRFDYLLIMPDTKNELLDQITESVILDGKPSFINRIDNLEQPSIRTGALIFVMIQNLIRLLRLRGLGDELEEYVKIMVRNYKDNISANTLEELDQLAQTSLPEEAYDFIHKLFYPPVNRQLNFGDDEDDIQN